jgi:LPPG:FO 2-phospho-L-lactate transferase
MGGPRRPQLTVVSGGLGGARLALAVVEAHMSANTVFITIVADDWTVGSLPVSPDTDAVLYALSGRFDEARGWGVLGDTFPGPLDDEPSWFGIGTLDRATHERRRALLAAGAGPAEVTAHLAGSAGVDATVLPVTDDQIRTRIRSSDRWLAFQEWMVRDRGPTVGGIRWDGLDQARPSSGVVEALAESELVVLASSSPMASLAPILGVSGVRQALEQRQGPTLALSPMVLGRPVTTDRDRHRQAARRQLLSAVGIAHTPSAIAAWMAPLVSHFAIDPSDVNWSDSVAVTGALPVLAPVIGIDPGERAALIELCRSLFGWSRSSHRTTMRAS